MLNSTIRFVLQLFLLAYPLFFLKLIPDTTETTKLAVLIVFDMLLLVLIAIKISLDQKIELKRHIFIIPLVLLMIVVSISSLVMSPNLAQTLTVPLGLSAYLGVFLLYLALVHTIDDSLKKNLLTILVFDAFVLSIYVITTHLHIVPAVITYPSGNLLSTFIFLVIILSFILWQLLVHLFKIRKNPSRKSFFSALIKLVPTSAIAAAAYLLALRLTTIQKPVILPLRFGTIILLDVFRSLKSFLLGIGLSNYITAFTFGKPAQINQTPYWNITFNSSSSYLLTLGSEAGFIALLLYLYLLVFCVLLFLSKNSQQHLIIDRPLLFSLIISLLLLSILPGSLTVFITVFILFALAVESNRQKTVNLSKLKIIVFVIPLISLITASFILFFTYRAITAEVLLKKSADEISGNRLSQAYNLQQQMLVANPYLPKYHLAFSQTSLVLANALSAKKTPSAVDEQNIPKLTQQAISEAKTALSLNRFDVVNWDNLSTIYASLSDYAVGSTDWAIETARQQEQIDPQNPNTKFFLGMLLLKQEKFAEAEKYFRSALALKDDLLNAHLSLATALKKQNKYQEAYLQLQKALSLSSPETLQYQKIQQELSDLKELLP